MDAETKYRIFQIKPGKPQHIAIDPKDPKDIKRIQAILEQLRKEKK